MHCYFLLFAVTSNHRHYTPDLTLTPEMQKVYRRKGGETLSESSVILKWPEKKLVR